MKLKIKKSIKIGVMVISIIFSLTACQKEPNCKLNDVVVNEDIVGTTRNDILNKLGQPTNSDIGIKGFDKFTFTENNKKYALILRYKIENDTHYVSSQKCIKAKPKFELFGHVIWH